MSAPSLLADNPSARIEIVQGGGGMTGGTQPTFSEDELKILTQYGIQPGSKLDSVILPQVKKQFLEQLSKSNCAIGTGENVILNSECSAVAQVIRAMILFNMKRTNGWGPKNLKISAKPPAVPGARQPVQPPPVPVAPVPGQLIDTSALIATIRARIDERHNGLVNCGATCYLNSALQMFSHVPELVNETSKNQRLYSIFNDLYKLPLQNINLDTRINNRLSLFNGMFPSIKTQQDVTEFMSRFYEEFKLDAPYFKIRQIQTIKCVNPPPSDLGLPGKTPVETTPGTITLPIQGGNSIQALLANIKDSNPLVNVEDCLTPGSGEARGPATQETRFEIPEENRYLVISLSRFRDTGRTEKGAQGRIVPVFERINTPIEINRQIEVGGVEYQLYGSILHTGNVKGGHYVFLKIKSDFSGSILYNDETVTDQSSIPNISVDTYVAIYKRMNVPAAAAEPPAASGEPSPAPPGSPAASPAPSGSPAASGEPSPAASPAPSGSPAASGEPSPAPAAADPHAADTEQPRASGAAAAAEPSPAPPGAPAASAEPPAAAGPAVVGAMPNLGGPSMEAREEVNLNAPVSNENAPGFIQATVDMLMELDPAQRKRTVRNGIYERILSTIAAIDTLPDDKPSGLTRGNITDNGIIKSDRITHILRNFSNYSKLDLNSVVTRVRSICLDTIKEGGILNSGDDHQIRQTLKDVEELLRELEILEYNIKQHNRMSAAPAPAAVAPMEEASVNYPDEYYEENPSNFQPGHLRINFQKEGHNAPGNRRVYANTTVGTRRMRIYGTNAANIKRKFNSRTRKLKAAANRAAATAATAARVASETRNAAQKAKNTREAAARAAAEAKKTLRSLETGAAKQAAANKKAAIRAKIAAGEPVSFMNRMRAKFGGSRRTRRKSRKSRRGGRK
jgi:ubiquitin C-terminal hydrolase